MIDKFESLPQEKKKRILDACIEEFALNGYDKASTNSIVKKAGISKGLLFHYFGSKKTLFLYVFDYCANYLIE
ncbi:TetR/AcrR family transcriptional regulator [Clostridium magnum]|uniref:HTH-type transcriptional repressor AcnR n=1 Tax=Clostridium magnum DSM 2767 TaxID=1121326 RepID=A0A161X8J6_9CLOT|nr:TetR/AcrR family transcriptional regulator [Clostridium magnum]KZL90506.1 HTH-type transcriptional repressor AcnR [Clostridium magnum DSM 2767]SHI03681.1 transcriptional regulator, TetR family [Clostridium magnum DSM 2767]